MWTLYIIECKNGQFYTGITENLDRRLKEHSHKGSHFTSYNPITKLLYTEEISTQIDAEKREAQIKNWTRAKKIALIKGDFKKLRQLSISRD